MSSTKAAMAAPAPAENCNGSGSGSGSGSGEMITLMSCDGERFEVAEAAARLSQTIAHMIEDDCAGGSGGIPLPNVNAKTLARILEYCNKHVDDDDAEADGTEGAAEFVAKKKALEIFDAGFIDVDKDVLYDVLLAANYLEVKGLLDLACQKVANMIKGKKPEEIRQAFGIVNDFTPEEEEEIRKENAWAFE